MLKPGGHFCVSDVVIKGELPEGLQKDAEMYAGCVSGASEIEEYLSIINLSGFSGIVINKQKEILLPENLLGKYISDNEINSFKRKEKGIYSITVSARKGI